VERDEWVVVPENALEFTLPTVFFTKGDHRLPPGPQPELDALAENLKKYPKYKVLIVGHTRYSSEEDKKLAADRADSVRKFLVACDVAQSIFGTEGRIESSYRGVTFVVYQRKK